MRIIFLLLTVLISASACNKKLKETVGISTPGPNEYEVQRAKMLEVPPHYDLPTPSYKQIPRVTSVKKDGLNEGEKALMQEIE